MPRSVEKIRPPVDGRRRHKRQKGERINRHYSQKKNHGERSIANNSHKKSKRRGNYG